MNIPIKLTNCVFKNVLKDCALMCIRGASHTRLVEVGRLVAPKVTEEYKTGQMFLHKLFGYRGVILFPWKAVVYNRNRRRRTRADSEQPQPSESTRKEAKGEEQTFYTALVDNRDVPFIRSQSEAVTFIAQYGSSNSLYAIPGFDYVAHHHVLPYTATQDEPLQHELWDKFLDYDPNKEPQFNAKSTLKVWQKRNRPWLQLSDVYMETTENVQVTVIPFYMGCRGHETYWWRYRVCLENLGEDTVQLRERHWRIFSLSGVLETVRGRGVVGQEPVLSRESPAFQYSSHVSLQAPSGHMWGTFKMERKNGLTFDCRVPPFALESAPMPDIKF
ncbi:polymerase delta-interacting protein 2-like [Homalodisca vitripennis]|uniref:polymerase delta-interacting protein 2-like n=1 Tax=Homalodisca vitripennis TaxID=197043 RepID=UPI001EEC2AED|nr:polymerase delta-interacting protein 2-like [Homalodisca vitripennis]KAG8322356.1 polymerase delta-interacting protein 2 [Homalodisca vitripennis]